jgi:hypothetical protein
VTKNFYFGCKLATVLQEKFQKNYLRLSKKNQRQPKEVTSRVEIIWQTAAVSKRAKL